MLCSHGISEKLTTWYLLVLDSVVPYTTSRTFKSLRTERVLLKSADILKSCIRHFALILQYTSDVTCFSWVTQKPPLLWVLHKKVDCKRVATSDSSPPTFSIVPDSISLSVFSHVTISDVASVVARLPNKSRTVETLSVSTWTLTRCRSVVTICSICLWTMVILQSPSNVKHAFLTKILKKFTRR